jgi:hypothetical protein
VQIVIRNAEVYRLVYGTTPPEAAPQERARVRAKAPVKNMAARTGAPVELRPAGMGVAH